MLDYAITCELVPRNVAKIVPTPSDKDAPSKKIHLHSAIRSLVADLYNKSKEADSEYLVTVDGESLNYGKYRQRFDTMLKHVGVGQGHKHHGPRNTFITLAKKYNVNEYAIKYMVCHSIQDLTERVYTDRSVEWLNEEIEK